MTVPLRAASVLHTVHWLCYRVPVLALQVRGWSLYLITLECKYTCIGCEDARFVLEVRVRHQNLNANCYTVCSVGSESENIAM